MLWELHCFREKDLEDIRSKFMQEPFAENSYREAPSCSVTPNMIQNKEEPDTGLTLTWNPMQE